MPNNQNKLNIGILIHEIINIVPTKFISGALKSALDFDLNILFFIGNALKSPHNFEAQANVIYELISKKRLDGIIIWSSTLATYISHNELLDFINRYSLPAVSVDLELKSIPSILLGDYQGMYNVLNHLVKVHGYKKIGFIKAVESLPNSIKRFRAYEDILKENNIPFDQRLVPKGEDNWEGIAEIKALMDSHGDDLDAIASVSDASLKFAIPLIRSYGKKVPEDIALVGFDNNKDMSVSDPPLTTIEPSHFNLGYKAVEMLKVKIEGKDIPEVSSIQPKLIIRQSCGCPSLSVKRSAISNKETVNDYQHLNKKSPIEEINKIFNNSKIKIESILIEQLWKTFILDIKNDRGGYLNILSEISKIILKAEEIDILQDALSIMLYLALKKFKTSVMITKSISYIEQGRVLIAEIALRIKEDQHIQSEELQKKINVLNQALITTFDINGLMSILSKGLPEIGVKKCYISIYENPANSIEEARLILAFDEDGIINIEQGGRLFKSKKLVPDDILRDEQFGEMLVMPLYFQQDQIGFILISTDIQEIRLYEALRAQISSALQGAILVKKIELNLYEINRSKVELEKAYKELNENQEKLLITEKMASLGRLTAGIAHEMNTPIAAIRTSVDNLNDLVDEYDKSIGNSQVTDEDHKSIVADMKKILKNVEISSKKSADFLRGIKGQTINLVTKNKEKFIANAIIDDTLNLIDFIIKKSNCRLEKNLDNSVILYGNPRSLSQIITNLINNAVDACLPDGGLITINLKNIDEKTVLLQIEDTGTGIPLENITKIFDPMFTTKPFGQGTGLGLSIVYDLVKELNGIIKVISHPGKTIFSIKFFNE